MAKKVVEDVASLNVGGQEIHSGDTLIFNYTKSSGETLDYALQVNGLSRTHVYGAKLGAPGMRSFIANRMREVRKV